MEMKWTASNGNKLQVQDEVEELILILDNGNELHIQEIESGAIRIINISDNPSSRNSPLGLRLYPIDIQTIEIVPEG